MIIYDSNQQLGMMVICIGLSSYALSLYHLINHAFYKALLFLGAGSVIHSVSDNQDFRRYGGLRPFLPLTYSVMLIASLSLVAFPFMTGFYSKDFILESAYGKYDFSGTVVYIIATIGAMFTTLYSVKVLYLTFLTNPNGPLINYKQAHEGNMFMSLPLIILAVFSIFFGFITKDMFIGLGSGFFSDNALFIHPSHEIMLDTEFGVPTLFKLLPLMFTVSLTVIVIVLSEYLSTTLIYFKLSRVGYNIFSFFNQRFLIELFYNKYITGIILKLGGQTTKEMDKGSVEYAGPFGLMKMLYHWSIKLSKSSSGFTTDYALYFVVAMLYYFFSISFELDTFIIMVITLTYVFFGNSALNSKNDILQSSINPGSNNNNSLNNTDTDVEMEGSNTEIPNNSNNPLNNDDVEMEDCNESSNEVSESDENSDSDESSKSMTDPTYTSEEAMNRNERDMEEYQRISDKNKELRDLFGTAEKIRDKKELGEKEYGDYLDADQPGLDELEGNIQRNVKKLEELDEKMHERKQPDYELSEDGDSECSQPNNNPPVSNDSSSNNPPVSNDSSNNHPPISNDSSNNHRPRSPDSLYDMSSPGSNNGQESTDSNHRPASPDSSNNGPSLSESSNNIGSSLSDNRSSLVIDFDNDSRDTDFKNDSPDTDFIYKTDPVEIDFMIDPLYIDFFIDFSKWVDKSNLESLCSALYDLQYLFIEVPLISMLGLSYRFYKLGFFHALTRLYKLSFFHALMCSLTSIFLWFIFLLLLMIIFIFIII